MLLGMAEPLISADRFRRIGNETFGPGRGQREERPGRTRGRGGAQMDVELDGKVYAYEPESGRWYDRSDMSGGQSPVRDRETLGQLNTMLEQQEQQGMDNVLRGIRTGENRQQPEQTVMGQEPQGTVMAEEPSRQDREVPDVGMDADQLERLSFQANNNPQILQQLATMYQQQTGETPRNQAMVIGWARDLSKRMRGGQ